MIKANVDTIGVFKTVPRKLTFSLKKNSLFVDFIHTAAAEYPEIAEVLYSSQIELVVILCNGKSIFLQNGFETPLFDGDEIFIGPLIHGG